MLSEAFLIQGRIDLAVQAKPILKKAITLQNPPNPQIDYHYGVVLMDNGEYEDAEKYLKRAVSASHIEYEGRQHA